MLLARYLGSPYILLETRRDPIDRGSHVVVPSLLFTKPLYTLFSSFVGGPSP